ncbi:uncharacterized protein N7498_008968 [Penicillium cinerascens]|uniref:Uncharacterized protein n=1 Tax=Penicillium cinerascens TaxID=70096 RepID=A0A9W9JEQ2_9EURO|nr:uncharacterized protein N7498_008968 [Penicillium cinerascens]KAJ5195530.1 hypothetical protein N7498_008968 [Penicillium cinerascens]
MVQVQNATETFAAGRNIEGPTIKRLLRHTAIIGMRVPDIVLPENAAARSGQSINRTGRLPRRPFTKS